MAMSMYGDHAEDIMDSDALLTQIESKLRGPFTSIDFAKAVSSANIASNEYLSSALSVLPRAEKITQLRILIGTLGLEPSALHDDEIQQILATAQNGPLYEEWVRVISGIVEDILFRSDSYPINKSEANRLLDKTSSEIVTRIKELEKDTAFREEETAQPLTQRDANPLFIPYRYKVLSPGLLDAIVPDSKVHCHFRTNPDSEILLMDMNMEIEKLKEEQDHHVAISTFSKSELSAMKTETVATSLLHENNQRKSANVRVKSSSMFMPSKPRAGVGQAFVGTGTAAKQQLHQRKAGAAQALLAKGRRGRILQSSAGNAVAASTQAAMPRQFAERTAVTTANTLRGGSHKSKMKMIDVAEVQGLESKKQQEVGKVPAPKSIRAHTLTGRKRPHDELGKEHLAASRGKKHDKSKSALTVEKQSIEKDQAVKHGSNVSSGEMGNAGELASAALLAYQSRTTSIQPSTKSPYVATEVNDASLNMTKQQDWRELLQVRSNRLTEADRQRIQQFFVDRLNPTPQQRQYKMKLHEERTSDTATGKAMKETYYLELDYETYTSTQTKKVKRYDD